MLRTEAMTKHSHIFTGAFAYRLLELHFAPTNPPYLGPTTLKTEAQAIGKISSSSCVQGACITTLMVGSDKVVSLIRNSPHLSRLILLEVPAPKAKRRSFHLVDLTACHLGAVSNGSLLYIAL